MRAQSHRLARVGAALLWFVLLAAAASGQDSVAAARQLYGGAAYEEALAMLDRLKSTELNGDAPAVEQQRALCLLALGRADEAEKAIEAVIVSNASYQPDPDTTSPRVQAAFRDVRRKLLPGITRQRYLAAKAAFDRKDYWSAVEGFDTALTLIGNPADDGADGTLVELRTLILGFRDLARTAMPSAPAPASNVAARVKDVLPPPPPAPPKELFGIEDADVVAPVAVSQRMPPWTGQPLAMLQGSNRRGLLELVISDTGDVVSAVLRQGTGTYYDRAVSDTAKNWKYSPATRNGKPVKYRKLLQFNIQ